MTWLFFTDESGHDHKQMPYEVRGGFAIHVSKLWPFAQAMQLLEKECFGCRLSDVGTEIKGSSLLKAKRFEFAAQGAPIPDHDRRQLCRSFFATNSSSDRPTRDGFTAYGQACLRMAQGIIALLKEGGAVLMATAIPRGVVRPPNYRFDHYLRKDAVFLFERFHYFLETKREHGLLVMDETEKREDHRFVARMEKYFTQTAKGRERTKWIVPTPFFVSSDLACAVQAADVCIYVINWGFRLPSRGMDAARRDKIAEMFGADLTTLQYRGQQEHDGRKFSSYGITCVRDPYESRART